MLKQHMFFLFIFFGVSTYAQTIDSVPVKKKPVPPWWVQRFSVSAGIFVPLSNTQLEVGSEDGSFGTTIDLEDDLGFKQTTSSFVGNLQWRASRRSRFDLNYFQINRKSSYTTKKDIEFKDTTFPANSSLNASTNSAIFQFSYGYAFFLNPRFEAGLAIGAHIVGSKVGMGIANSGGSTGKETDYDFTAPLPDIGIWGGYGIGKQWAVNGAFNYLSLTVGDIKGRILSYNVGVTYDILKNFSATLMYAGLNFNVDLTKDHYKSYFKWGYNGPALTINYAFGKNKWRE
jgi:hypothetical protein